MNLRDKSMKLNVKTYKRKEFCYSRLYRSLKLLILLVPPSTRHLWKIMRDRNVISKRLLTLIVACIENVFYGAVILGWPSLVFVFKQMGYFEAHCNGTSENANSTLTLKPTETSSQVRMTGDPTTSVHLNLTSSSLAGTPEGGGPVMTTPSFSLGPTATVGYYHGNETSGRTTPICWEQDAQLQVVYSVGFVFATLSMFPTGLFFDRFGTRRTRIVLTIFLFIGHVFCGLSATTGVDHFLFPGIALLVVASTMLLLSSMQIGNLFPSHRATAISCIQGTYGAAVLLFFVFKACYEAGLHISICFYSVAGLTVFLNINTFVFLPRGKIPWPQERRVSADNAKQSGQRAEPNTETNSNHLTSDDITELTHSGSENRTETYTHNQEKQRFRYLKDCLASLPFLLVLVWQVVLEFDLIFTIGTVNYFLTLKTDGDNELVSRYTDILSMTLALVFLVGPLGGLLIDRKKTWRSLTCNKGPPDGLEPTLSDASLPVALTSLTSAAYSVCLLFGNLHLQILTFVFLLFLEALLFGVGSAVVAMIFPAKYFASVYGALRTVSGLATFIQYPVFILIQKVLANDPFYVIVALVIADMITLIFPAYLFFSSRSLHQYQNVSNRHCTESAGKKGI